MPHFSHSVDHIGNANGKQISLNGHHRLPGREVGKTIRTIEKDWTRVQHGAFVGSADSLTTWTAAFLCSLHLNLFPVVLNQQSEILTMLICLPWPLDKVERQMFCGWISHLRIKSIPKHHRAQLEFFWTLLIPVVMNSPEIESLTLETPFNSGRLSIHSNSFVDLSFFKENH